MHGRTHGRTTRKQMTRFRSWGHNNCQDNIGNGSVCCLLVFTISVFFFFFFFFFVSLYSGNLKLLK